MTTIIYQVVFLTLETKNTVTSET